MSPSIAERRGSVVALDSSYLRSDQVVGRRIASEFLLVPLVGRGANLDSIYSLNRVGTFIWDRLDGTLTGRAVVAALCSRFEVDRPQAEVDYCDFVADLLEIRAVTAVAPPGPP